MFCRGRRVPRETAARLLINRLLPQPSLSFAACRGCFLVGWLCLELSEFSKRARERLALGRIPPSLCWTNSGSTSRACDRVCVARRISAVHGSKRIFEAS